MDVNEIYCGEHFTMSVCVCACASSLSHVQLFGIPWTVVHQASSAVGFSRQEYWSRQPVPSPGDLPDPGIKPRPPALQADSLATREAPRVDPHKC